MRESQEQQGVADEAAGMEITEEERVQKYVYLVFCRRMCRISVNDLSEKYTTLERMENVKLWRAGVPVGMGAFILDSKLYMAGGENTLVFDYEKHGWPDPLEIDGVNSAVFALDPGSDLDPENGIPPMKAGKPHPKVAIIDRKIYVLGRSVFKARPRLPSPQFECYDPDKKMWYSLEDPPYHSSMVSSMDSEEDSEIWESHFGRCILDNVYAIGRIIYVHDFESRRVYFYDVDEGKWEEDRCIEERYRSARIPFPFSLTKGCFAERKWGAGLGLVIAYTCEDGLIAYLYDHCADGRSLPTRHQILLSVNSRLLTLSNHVGKYCNPVPPSVFIRELGEDDDTFVLVSNDFELIQFAIFHLGRLQTSEGDFLDAELLHHHVFDFYDRFFSSFPVDCSEMENVLVCEHPRKRDALCASLPASPDDRSFQKQRPVKSANSSSSQNKSKASAIDKNTVAGENKKWIMVVDTNCLLNNELRKALQFLQGLKGTRLIIPRIVIRELDCIKRRGTPVRRTAEASSALLWIRDCMVNTKWWIHLQSSVEEGRPIAPTPPATPLSRLSEGEGFTFSSVPFSALGDFLEIITPTADDHILGCALLFRRNMKVGQFVLLSDNVVLQMKALAEGLICEAVDEFRESLVNPFSERFLWADSSPRGQTWSRVDDIVLRERVCGWPLKNPSNLGEGAEGLKLILLHSSHYRQINSASYTQF